MFAMKNVFANHVSWLYLTQELDCANLWYDGLVLRR